MRIHNMENLHIANSCPKKNPQNNNLKMHMTTLSGENLHERELFKCSQCDNSYADNLSLLYHFKTPIWKIP